MEGGGEGDVTDDTGGSRRTIILLGCVVVWCQDRLSAARIAGFQPDSA